MYILVLFRLAVHALTIMMIGSLFGCILTEKTAVTELSL